MTDNQPRTSDTSDDPIPLTNPKVVWVGRIISAMVCLLLTFSAAGKLFAGAEEAAETTSHIGLPMSLMTTIAAIELTSVALYAVPQTAIVGAILLTGYMGGAIFAHVRVGDPPVIQTIVPILVWLGIFLRDARLRDLMPWRKL